MKYIMFEVTEDKITRKVPFIFPSQLVHSMVAHAVHPLMIAKHDTAKLVSAGEWSKISGEACGFSETLKLESHPDDTLVIKSYDYAHGLEGALMFDPDELMEEAIENGAMDEMDPKFKLNSPDNREQMELLVKIEMYRSIIRGIADDPSDAEEQAIAALAGEHRLQQGTSK